MKVVCALAASAIFSLTLAGANAQEQSDFVHYYPRAALEQGRGGAVMVECVVAENGRLDCTPLHEFPADLGFGQAVVDMSREWRMAPTTSAGVSTAGSRIRRAIRFVPGPPAELLDVTSEIATLQWQERPTAQHFARYFPPRALEASVSGAAMLSCLVNAHRELECVVESETPAGYGFGEAALRLSENFRLAPQTAYGQDTIGGRVRVPIRMNVAN